MWAIQYLPATTISMYFCVDPPATALFAAIFLHEQIHSTQAIGSILILFGMWVTIKHGEEGEISDDAKRDRNEHIGSINGPAASDCLSVEQQEELNDDEDDEIGETTSLLKRL